MINNPYKLAIDELVERFLEIPNNILIPAFEIVQDRRMNNG